MIKLPLVNTTTDVDNGLINATKGAGTKGLSDDFLSLFSQALPGQITLEDGKTLSLGAALTNTVAGKGLAAQDDKEGRTTLAALFDGLDLDKPETLSALLNNVTKGTGQDKTTSSEETTGTTKALSTADMQALSALFAMLPQQNTATPVASLSSLTVKDTDETVSLSSLLAGSSVQKNSSGRAEDTLNTAVKTAAVDAKVPGKTAAPVAGQVTEDALLPVATPDKDARESAISNNTTPTVTAPTMSAATVSTPLSTHIATPLAPQISAQLGSQEWQQAVSQHVTLFTRQGQQSAELRLHPEDLGQIQISLKLDDNQAQLQMVSAHSHVRAALEATLPALRIALAESGIQLGQSNISSGENFAQTQQQSGQQQQQSQRSAGAFPPMDNEAEAHAVPASIQRQALGNSAVDIFA